MNFPEMLPKKNEEILKNFYESGFSVEKKLKELEGPFVEVAGPTTEGYELVNLNKLDKKLFVSNLRDSPWRGKIDFRSDVRKLPIIDNSVSALFVSNLGGPQFDSPEEFKQLRNKFFSEKRDLIDKKEIKKFIKLSNIEFRKLKNEAIKEAFRIVEDKGLLIWQGGDKEDIIYAEHLGFVKKVIQNTLDRSSLNKSPQLLGNAYDCIFEKISLEKGK